jgi:hypothetical protein
MNIVMFICACKWIVSLTIILKCLLNYEIKICQNVAYHLTYKPLPYLEETAALFATFERPKYMYRKSSLFEVTTRSIMGRS